jgi:hypothetical protein
MSAGQTVILGGLSSRQKAENLVNAAPSGHIMTIKPPTRTNEQNALMWALLSELSRAKPEGRCLTPDVWKAVMMQACGHAVQFELGIDGHPFPLGFRSSRLSKEQMSELIEFIREYGARCGVEFTDPKEARDAE